LTRIVITGYGVKAPGVSNRDEFRKVLEKGICTQEVLQGIGPKNSSIVCGVIHENFEIISGKKYNRYPRVSQLAIAATVDAVEMAGLHNLNDCRIAVIIGTSTGGYREFESSITYTTNDTYENFPYWTAGLVNMHSVSSAVAAHLGIKPQAFTLSTGCTASTDAVLMGQLLLESNKADVCIVGGAETPLSRIVIYSLARLNLLPIDMDVNQSGVPFSSKHNGFVISEGAGVLILEREVDAVSRKAPILGVIHPVSTNNDGVSINGMDRTGKTMISALKNAIGDITPTYINSQALGLKDNDRIDSIAHQTLFGTSIPITSIKGMIGHAFGASGALQIISSLLSIEHGFIPPTIKSSGEGYSHLPIVFQTRYCEVSHVAITSHGYGGNNACVLLSKY
jgi:3-oxoacyl-(acyl-carrier-protein) synthase